MSFTVRFSPWLRPLFVLLGMAPRRSEVTVGEDSIQVRLGWAFRAEVPIASVRSVSRTPDVWWAVGVHTDMRGRWIVNGSPRGMVAFELDPAVRGRGIGLGVRIRRLLLSLEEPDAFVEAVRRAA